MRQAIVQGDQVTGHSECHLISGVFAQCLQIILGLLAMSTLVYKRHTETVTQRPYEVWLMDVSKQGVQSVFIHFTNIALAVVFSGMMELEGNSGSSEAAGAAGHSHDECAFYFISFVLDTFLGVHLIWLVLKAVRVLAVSFNWTSLKDQGYYGVPPSFDWYVKQLYVFLGATAISKFIIGFVMLAWKFHIDALGTFLFQGFRLRPATELTIVMIICPAFLNTVQYWLQDNILQSSGRHDYSMIADASKSVDEDDDLAAGKNPSVSASPSTPAGVFFRIRTNS